MTPPAKEKATPPVTRAIVFMADAPENVREASAAGLRAFHVKTPDDVFRLTAGLIGANTP